MSSQFKDNIFAGEDCVPDRVVRGGEPAQDVLVPGRLPGLRVVRRAGQGPQFDSQR